MKELVSAGNDVPLFLCKTPCDMRLGLPGLAEKVKKEARRDPYKKGIYIFVSSDFKRIKLFYYDNDGFAMWYKHVPRGAFRIKWTSGFKSIDAVNLKQLLGAPSSKRRRLPEA